MIHLQKIVSVVLIASLVTPLGNFPTRGEAADSGLKLTWEEVQSLSPKSKEKLRQAFIEFARALERDEVFKVAHNGIWHRFPSLIALVEANAGADCFFGGWPSQSKGGLCDRPHRGNQENYARMLDLSDNQNTPCKQDPSNHLLCNPMLFGNGVCISVSPPSSAFSRCEAEFEQVNSGKEYAKVTSVSEALWTIASENKQVFMDMVGSADMVCTSGVQSTKPMCELLKERFSEIRAGGSGNPQGATATGAFTPGMVEAWSENLDEAVKAFDETCKKDGQVAPSATLEDGTTVDCAEWAKQIQDRLSTLRGLNEFLDSQQLPKVDCVDCRQSGTFDVAAALSNDVEELSCKTVPKDEQECAKSLTCNITRSANSFVANSTLVGAVPPFSDWVRNKFSNASGCNMHEGGNCFDELITSVFSAIFGIFKTAWDLGAAAAKGAWNWATSWIYEDSTTDVQQAAGAMSAADLELANQDPQGFMSKIVDTLKRLFTHDAGCLRWAGGAPDIWRTNCAVPFDMKCVGCGEALNIACAVGGMVLGELGTAILTLGTVNAVKHTAKLALKFGPLLISKVAQRSPFVARAMQVTGQRAAGAVLRVGEVSEAVGARVGRTADYTGTKWQSARSKMKKVTLHDTKFRNYIREMRVVRGPKAVIRWNAGKLASPVRRLTRWNIAAGKLGWKGADRIFTRVDNALSRRTGLPPNAVAGSADDVGAAATAGSRASQVDGAVDAGNAAEVAADGTVVAGRVENVPANRTLNDPAQNAPPQGPRQAEVDVPAAPAHPRTEAEARLAPLPKPKAPVPNRARDIDSPKPIKAETVPGNRVHYGDDAQMNYRHLESNNLLPTKSVGVGSSNVKVGEVFPIGSGRYGAMLEIEHNGRKYLRAAYRSNSESSWRVMPSYVSETPMGGAWFDKSGVGEHATTLPSSVQKYLADEISAGRVRTDLNPKDGAAILTGGTRHNENFDDLVEWRKTPDALEAEVKNVQIVTAKVKEPSQITIPQSSMRPDFSRQVRQYKVQSSLAGEVDAYVYRSADGSTEYTIFKDIQDRIWFGSPTRPNSSLNAYGVHTEAADIGDLGKPLWEYREQVPSQYRGSVNPNRPEYVDSWKFLREIPEIRRWYETTGTVMPK